MEFAKLGDYKTILEKYAEPIVKKVVKISRDEWEKFKVDFDLAFIKYTKNSFDKYSKIKTILYRTEPKYIYDFFETPILEKGHDMYIQADDIDAILDVSNFIIIQGTGGIGKSTLLKHIFISELGKKDLIPIFLELKDVNNLGDDYDLTDIIFEKLDDLGSSIKREYLNYALKSGCFLFLLDGYDEVLTDKKDILFKKLDSFCDKYSTNYFVISSRPYSEFVEFQRFTVLTTCALNKGQAMSLINKIEFDMEIKQRFVKALDEELYDKHRSFASNPLLLNIMLLTFDNYAEIPEKLHLFYANAFETLYSKHDATKAGYKRELRSGLSYDSFRKVFSYFCFITYHPGQIEFTRDELINILKKTQASKVSFDINHYIYDLENSLCVLYRDGVKYKFTHRSFQEYFTAVFLKELSDTSMKQMALHLIEKDAYRISHDDVFVMLYDMAEERYEQNIFLPVLTDFEKKCEKEDKYDFYFSEIVEHIKFAYRGDEQLRLWLVRSVNDDVTEFIYRSTRLYVNRLQRKKLINQEAEDKLLQFLTENRNYKIQHHFDGSEIMKDEEVYELMRYTWIGGIIETMAGLSEKLKEKQLEMEIDLSNLVGV